MSTKKCDCGNTAWFGNFCHECREKQILAVTHRRTLPMSDALKNNCTQHSDMRRPMSEAAINTYGGAAPGEEGDE